MDVNFNRSRRYQHRLSMPKEALDLDYKERKAQVQSANDPDTLDSYRIAAVVEMLESEMGEKLSMEVGLESQKMQKPVQMFHVYLSEQEIESKISIQEICFVMKRRGLITPGKYEVLLDTFSLYESKRCYNVAKAYARKIEEIQFLKKPGDIDQLWSVSLGIGLTKTKESAVSTPLSTLSDYLRSVGQWIGLTKTKESTVSTPSSTSSDLHLPLHQGTDLLAILENIGILQKPPTKDDVESTEFYPDEDVFNRLRHHIDRSVKAQFQDVEGLDKEEYIKSYNHIQQKKRTVLATLKEKESKLKERYPPLSEAQAMGISAVVDTGQTLLSSTEDNTLPLRRGEYVLPVEENNDQTQLPSTEDSPRPGTCKEEL